ncbi:MAG: AbrB/MazE/SpoVT family DNA-binding domain-containing protein [Clostridia bacterium]|nr:AbrB/MazE/SpoVT family DNA-binding domain-containing protein [Clostridia bacterium]
MEISRMSSKGQVTIPVSVRNKLGLKAGDNVVIFEDNGRFYIENASAISLQYIGPETNANLKVAEPTFRYCTVRESLEESLKEVKEMREGKRPEMTIDELFDNIKRWVDEVKEDENRHQ